VHGCLHLLQPIRHGAAAVLLVLRPSRNSAATRRLASRNRDMPPSRAGRTWIERHSQPASKPKNLEARPVRRSGQASDDKTIKPTNLQSRFVGLSS